jgi:hypothetical protein
MTRFTLLPENGRYIFRVRNLLARLHRSRWQTTSQQQSNRDESEIEHYSASTC